MKILYLTQIFSPTMGGGEVVFYNLAKKMSLRGHEVHVICHRLSNTKELNVGNVHIHRIRPTIAYSNALPVSMFQNLGYIVSAICFGFKLILNEKIDVIHANSYGSIIAASILSKLHTKPMVATIHDIFTSGSSDNWRSWAKQNKLSKISSLLGPIFEKISVRMPIDVIHSISEATKEDIINFSGKKNIVVIPNGIELSDYQQVSTKSNQKYLLFIGRLVFYKNLNVVISCLNKVKEEIPSAKLVVVGDGPMKDVWEKMVRDLKLEDNVEFVGFVSQERKVQLLGDCTFLVLPSVFEGFGLVLLEAFAMSKPVLVADVKPFDEVVEDKIDGYFIPVEDIDKWSQKVIFLLSNNEICETMGKKGRAKVENTFNLDIVTQKMESLYFKLLRKT